MKQILVKILFITLAAATHQASAQSLQELINTALEKNYQIQIVKNAEQIAVNNNVRGNTGQLPTVDLVGEYSNTFNNTEQTFADGTVREGTNARNTNLNLSAIANWTLFNGFSVYAKRDQLSYLEQLGQLNTKFYIEQTVSDIVTAYYQLMYEKELLENFRESLKISAFRLNIEEKRKEVGAGKAIDYGQALVAYQTDSILVLRQINTIQSLEVELNRVLNNDLENKIEVDDYTFNMLLIPAKDSLFSMVANNNNQLEQQRLEELIAETELRLAKTNLYPKIDLFAGYKYSNTTADVGFFVSNQNFGPTLGVSVSYNLFNGGATRRDIKNTKIIVENSNLTKQQVHQTIDADVLNLYNEYTSITQRMELANSNVDAMNIVYGIAEEQLKTGAINGYDFRLTQLSLLNAELTLMHLQFSLKAIEVNLNRMSGRVLQAYM